MNSLKTEINPQEGQKAKAYELLKPQSVNPIDFHPIEH